MKLFLSFIALFFISTSAFAADVSIVAPDNVKKGENFTISVILDTEGVPINSFDVTIAYPRDIFSFSGYKEDGSVKRIWIAHPKVESNGIHFSGIIPGGVEGMYNPDKKELQPLNLIQLIFSAKNTGSGSFSFVNSSVLQNDGKGTPLAHTYINKDLMVLESTDVEYQLVDTKPPEPFIIDFIPTSVFSRSPSMIAFSTTDNDSGVEKYQLYTPSSTWKDVVSPVQVTKGILKRDVVVRAVDFIGNTRESSIQVPGVMSNIQFFAIILIVAALYFSRRFFKRKK